MKTGITILVVMVFSITVLLIMAYVLKSREKYDSSDPYPPGSYQDSCYDIGMVPGTNTLYADCDDYWGYPTSSQLNVTPDCTYIQNIGGTLTC